MQDRIRNRLEWRLESPEPEGKRHNGSRGKTRELARDCIAEAGREIRQLRKLLFLSLVVNVALSGAVIIAIILK